MIKTPLTKILFWDIETVGITKDFETLEREYPALTKQFHNYFDWFLKRFPEDQGLTPAQVFVNRAALVPEFSRIVCASFAFVGPDGKIHAQTFSGENEKELLLGVNALLDKVFKLDFWLCGHNIKMFDIPTLQKRMVIHGIKPSVLLPGYDTKPWEIKAIDTREVWQFGQYASISTLDLMCGVMDVESSKSEEMDGSRVHEVFWNEKNYEKINKYCEKDVIVLYNVVSKFLNLK